MRPMRFFYATGLSALPWAILRMRPTCHDPRFILSLRIKKRFLKRWSAKLKFAFLVWTVTPYEMILRSREAKELIFCAYEFASDVLNESGSAFEVLLTKMLEPVIKKSGNKTISAKKLAHILRGSARGLKEVAKDSKELRMLINDFVDLIMQVC